MDRGGAARRRPAILQEQAKVETKRLTRVQPAVLTARLPCQGRRRHVAALYPKINSLRCLCWAFPTAPVRLSVPIVDRRPAHIERTEKTGRHFFRPAATPATDQAPAPKHRLAITARANG